LQIGKCQQTGSDLEGFTGEEKRFTFNDMRVLTNTIANFLMKLGLKHGDRVCLFMDKVPELYFGFLVF